MQIHKILTSSIIPFGYRVSVPESWAENSHRIIQKSQNRRIKSTQLRTESENTINECANAMWNSWNFTNNALSRRANEILEAKNKLQMHLHKVKQPYNISNRGWVEMGVFFFFFPFNVREENLIRNEYKM